MKKIAIQIIIFSLLIISQSAYGAHSILLVINMQKGLLDTNSSMHVQNSMVDGVVKNVNENIAVARQKNIPIIYIRNEWSNFIWNYFTGNVCKKGSKQAELDDRISVVDSLTFTKSLPSAFSNKSFCNYLNENKIDTIYVEGVMAEACVYATGKDGIKRNLTVVMLEDAIGSTSSKKKEKMTEKYLKEHMRLQKQL